MTLTDGLEARNCPVCDRPARDAEPFLGSTVDAARVDSYSFASRKVPEYMSLRLVRCRSCDTVFAAEAPRADSLAQAYGDASYDSAEEAQFAADTYARELAPRITADDLSGIAMEVGTGTGAFLRHLKRLGFRETIGIEPSAAAIDAAEDDVRPSIRSGIFRVEDHAPGTLSLFCCFQTLEHVRDPKALTEAAFALLRPGGQIAFVTHDYRAPINRLLGRRSPIIDIEHMQLFCPGSLRHLLAGSGFESVDVGRIRNTYPLRYWLRLLPLPRGPKASLTRLADAVGAGRRTLSLDVGNLLAVGRKPMSAPAGDLRIGPR